MSTTYIIVHGFNGSPEGHWQYNLYHTLQENGEKVLFPQFPESDKPNVDTWLDILHKTVKSVSGNITIICHSLGSVLWFHYANRFTHQTIDKVILVAPAGEHFINNTPEITGFAPIPKNEKRLNSISKATLLIASQHDFYCQEDATIFYGEELHLNTYITPPESGHINIDSGYGEWDDFFEITGIEVGCLV